MFALLALCLLCSTAWADNHLDRYSFSVPVGSSTGSRYATSGFGRITAVRMWELSDNLVTGFQLRYGFTWTPLIGRNTSNRVEMSLFDEDEAIVQLSGKYNPNNFIHQLSFVTSRGRSLTAGQPQGLSFSHYPTNSQSELRIISGRVSSAGITSLGAHWADVEMTGYEAILHETDNAEATPLS